MKLSETDLNNISYLTYKRMYDMENGTDYAKKHNEMFLQKHDEQTEIKRVELQNGIRNIIGNYNDENVLIEKCFQHLNAMKRAQTLSTLTDDENVRLFNENTMYKQRDALELTLRTLKQKFKK